MTGTAPSPFANLLVPGLRTDDTVKKIVEIYRRSAANADAYDTLRTEWLAKAEAAMSGVESVEATMEKAIKAVLSDTKKFGAQVGNALLDRETLREALVTLDSLFPRYDGEKREIERLGKIVFDLKKVFAVLRDVEAELRFPQESREPVLKMNFMTSWKDTSFDWLEWQATKAGELLAQHGGTLRDAVAAHYLNAHAEGVGTYIQKTQLKFNKPVTAPATATFKRRGTRP